MSRHGRLLVYPDPVLKRNHPVVGRDGLGGGLSSCGSQVLRGSMSSLKLLMLGIFAVAVVASGIVHFV